MTPRATLRPMPAFAAVLRPGDSAVTDDGKGVEANVDVDFEVGEDEVVLAADGGEDVEADDGVGVEVVEDEDVLVAGTEADHVVAGRPNLWWCLQVSGCFCT